MASYLPESIVREHTAACVARGERTLQILRTAHDPVLHARRLLQIAQPEHGARVIDVGSGTGYMMQQWAAERGDLDLSLLNISAAQHAWADPAIERVVGDMESMPYPDSSADVLVYAYSIGHADIDLALAETHRVLVPGGRLLVYDMATPAPCRALDYTTHTAPDWRGHCARHGFTVLRLSTIPAQDCVLSDVAGEALADIGGLDALFPGAHALVLLAEKDRHVSA